jgi:hypothetical protein
MPNIPHLIMLRLSASQGAAKHGTVCSFLTGRMCPQYTDKCYVAPSASFYSVALIRTTLAC